jgi:hypothetical protein
MSRGHVPIAARIEVRGDHLQATFACAPSEELEITGSIPKGISDNDLKFRSVDGI